MSGAFVLALPMCAASLLLVGRKNSDERAGAGATRTVSLTEEADTHVPRRVRKARYGALGERKLRQLATFLAASKGRR